MLDPRNMGASWAGLAGAGDATGGVGGTVGPS